MVSSLKLRKKKERRDGLNSSLIMCDREWVAVVPSVPLITVEVVAGSGRLDFFFLSLLFNKTVEKGFSSIARAMTRCSYLLFFFLIVIIHTFVFEMGDPAGQHLPGPIVKALHRCVVMLIQMLARSLHFTFW